MSGASRSPQRLSIQGSSARIENLAHCWIAHHQVCRQILDPRASSTVFDPSRRGVFGHSRSPVDALRSYSGLLTVAAWTYANSDKVSELVLRLEIKVASGTHELPPTLITFGQWPAAFRKNGFYRICRTDQLPVTRHMHSKEKLLTVTPTTTPGCGLFEFTSNLKSKSWICR